MKKEEKTRNNMEAFGTYLLEWSWKSWKPEKLNWINIKCKSHQLKYLS